MVFYTGTRFPTSYRNGAFVVFHGSWNRSPLPMEGFNIRFVPFKGELPSGDRTGIRDRLCRQGRREGTE